MGLNALPVESDCVSVDIDFVGVGSLHTHTHALELEAGTFSGSIRLNYVPQIT